MAAADERGSGRRSTGAEGSVAAGPNGIVSLSASSRKGNEGLLTWHDAAFREVHNLEELGESCARLDSTLASGVTRVTVLTKYAVRFRYPGAPYEPDLEEAQESIGLAREFVDIILARLPEGFLEESR